MTIAGLVPKKRPEGPAKILKYQSHNWKPDQGLNFIFVIGEFSGKYVCRNQQHNHINRRENRQITQDPTSGAGIFPEFIDRKATQQAWSEEPQQRQQTYQNPPKLRLEHLFRSEITNQEEDDRYAGNKAGD